jgi:hypothetical protein
MFDIFCEFPFNFCQFIDHFLKFSSLPSKPRPSYPQKVPNPSTSPPNPPTSHKSLHPPKQLPRTVLHRYQRQNTNFNNTWRAIVSADAFMIGEAINGSSCADTAKQAIKSPFTAHEEGNRGSERLTSSIAGQNRNYL